MIARRIRIAGVGAGILALALAACSQQGGQVAASSSPQEKTFTLKPDNATVKVEFLTGQLQDLRVSEQVEQATGKVVESPLLHAILKLKNVSTDQTARLIGGKVNYIDPEGKPILLAKERRDTSFTFNAYQTDHLDPGMETSQTIEVPFPAAALGANKLRDIRLDLTYTPLPYKQESITVPISVSG